MVESLQFLFWSLTQMHFDLGIFAILLILCEGFECFDMPVSHGLCQSRRRPIDVSGSQPVV